MNGLIRIGWAAALCVLLVLAPFTARAESDSGAISLVVDADPPSAVTFEGLAATLGADLRAPIVHEGGKVALTIRYRQRQLTVRADHGQGHVLERTIPVEPDHAEREASLLASNLARDESRELIEDLDARRPPPAPLDPPEEKKKEEPKAPRKEPPNVYASASFFYPLATNWGEPGARTYFDFTLLFGRAGKLHGAHIGALVHVVSDEMVGAQVDALASVTGNEARGVQAAGGLAFAREIRGVQTAPVTIAEDVRGVQVGAINIGRRVKGAQIGAINIADEVDGVQLGALSINRDGVHPIAFASNLAYTNLGLKLSTKYVYTTLAVVFGTLESDFRQLGTSGALGGHLPLDALLEHLDLEAETVITHVLPKKGTDIDDNLWLGGRATAGYNFAKHLRVFAGGGARFPLIVNNGRAVARPEAIAGVQF